MSKVWSLLFFVFTALGCAEEKSRHTFVALVPMEFGEPSLLDSLEKAVERCYGFQTIRMDAQSLPQHAYTDAKSPRYRADSLLRFLRQQKPDSIRTMLGFTSKDISTSKRDSDGNIQKPEWKYADWGVFGLGYLGGDACVVSTYRLKAKPESKFTERFLKVCLHEIGHNLGLTHCKSNQCLMRDAVEKLSTIDDESMELCGKCRAEIN